MPAFIVTTPDGRKLRVEAPEGATAEQALQQAQAQDRGSQSKLANRSNPQPKRLPPAPKRTWRQFIREQVAPIAQTGASYLDGLGLGDFVDEAYAFGASLPGARKRTLVPNQSNFDAAQQEWHDQREKFTKDHPVAHRTAQAVGLAGSFALPEARIVKGAGMGSRMANASLTAAGYSAVAGAGQGEGIRERLGNAATGGTVGAVIGGSAPAAIRAIRGAARSTRNTVAPYVSRAAGEEIASKLSERQIARTLDTSGLDPAQLAQDLTERHDLGVPTAIADLSDATRGLGAHAARKGGPGQSIVRSAIARRQANQASRVGDHIQASLGSTVDPHAQSAALSAQATRDAAPLYREAYEQPAAMTDEMRDLMATPAGRSALSYASRIAANERVPIEVTGFNFGPDGVPLPEAQLTPRGMDYVKRGLDDVVEESRNAMTGRLNLNTEGRSVSGVRQDWLAEVDRINPAYAEARKAAAGPLQDRHAFQMGLEDLPGSRRSTAGDARSQMANMGPAQVEQFRLGDRTRLANEVASRPHYSDATAPLSGNDARIALVREVHGEEAAERLQARIRAEEATHDTYSAVRANSAADDLSSLPEGPGALLTAGKQALTGHPLQAALTIGRSLDGGVGRIGPLLQEATSGRLLDFNRANAALTLADIKRRTVRDAIQDARLDQRASALGKIGSMQIVSHSGAEDGLYGPTEY